MENWLIALVAVGSIAAYGVLGGIAYAISKRIEILDGGEDAVSIFWPLFVLVGLVFVVGRTAARAGARIGGAIVDGVISWRERRRLPRATARRKGGQ